MDLESIWKFLGNSDLQGYTLIIPSVAVGNVGQLACDLLISSLAMKKIITIYSPAHIPVLGYDPYDLQSNTLSGCCEVYKSDSRKIAVLQLRAPLVHKFARTFLEDVVITFKEKKVKDIINLTSSFAHEKKHIMTSPFRYVGNDICSYKNKLNVNKWIQHDRTDGVLHIYGGGFASILYEICEEKQMPCLIIYKYCSEGDNIPDAYDMVCKLTQVCPLFPENTDIQEHLTQPASWKLLFGRPPPSDIY